MRFRRRVPYTVKVYLPTSVEEYLNVIEHYDLEWGMFIRLDNSNSVRFPWHRIQKVEVIKL